MNNFIMPVNLNQNYPSAHCSIYIPRISRGIFPSEIAAIFYQNGIGEVKRVDFAPIGKPPGFGSREDEDAEICCAFIHFWCFYPTAVANEILETIGNPDGCCFRFYYQGTSNYWLLIKNHSPVPDSVMNTHQIVENARLLERRVVEQETRIQKLEEGYQRRMDALFEKIQHLEEQVQEKTSSLQKKTMSLEETSEFLYVKSQKSTENFFELNEKINDLQEKTDTMELIADTRLERLINTNARVQLVIKTMLKKIYEPEYQVNNLCDFMNSLSLDDTSDEEDVVDDTSSTYSDLIENEDEDEETDIDEYDEEQEDQDQDQEEQDQEDEDEDEEEIINKNNRFITFML